jgi:hypothetical protein
VEEGWVQCDRCEGWVHQICGLFNKGRNDEDRGYLCPHCLMHGEQAAPRRAGGMSAGRAPCPTLGVCWCAAVRGSLCGLTSWTAKR